MKYFSQFGLGSAAIAKYHMSINGAWLHGWIEIASQAII
jgi:hypothetical protein